jgi:hypothetical protein
MSETYDTIVDYFDSPNGEKRILEIVDEDSAHNTFHNLITLYAATVSAGNPDTVQRIHDEIVTTLHLPYLFCTRTNVAMGMYCIPKRRIVTKKYEVYDTIGKLWEIMVSLKVHCKFSERFHREAFEISDAMVKHFYTRSEYNN